MIIVINFRELAMVAGTTTTALVLGIGAVAICFLPWFYSKSSDENDDQESTRIEKSIDPRSPIEESSPTSMGFRAICQRASDLVKVMIPKAFMASDISRGSGNEENATKLPHSRKLYEEHSLIELPISVASGFNDSQSNELVEVATGSRTMNISSCVDRTSAGHPRNVFEAPEQRVEHSKWTKIEPTGSSIYRQHFQQRYDDPRIDKEFLSNVQQQVRGLRSEEMPLDLSMRSSTKSHAKNSRNFSYENTNSSNFHAEHRTASKNNCAFNIPERASAFPLNKEKSKFIDDKNINGDRSDVKRKVFRDLLEFLRIKKASKKCNEASERSDSIKFYQAFSSPFSRDENENIVPNRANILLENNIKRDENKVEFENSKISCDRGFSRKLKKIFSFRSNLSDKLSRLDESEKNIIPEKINSAPWKEISLLTNNDDSREPKTKEFRNISTYLKMANIMSLNEDYIEPCTEL